MADKFQRDIFHFKAFVPNVEVRKAEYIESREFTTKEGKTQKTRECIELTVLTEDEDRVVFKDYDITNKDIYTKGTIGTIELHIDIEVGTGNKPTITFANFKENKPTRKAKK